MAKQQKTSPSDMTERQPIGGAASAGGSGHLGAALSAVILAEAGAIGEMAERQAMSRKDRLSQLIKLSTEDRTEFRASMLAAQTGINVDAKAVPNRSLVDYMEDFPRAKSIYTEASMWIGVCKAVEAGWVPKNDKGETIEQSAWPEWRLITMQANRARDSSGKTSTDPANPQLVSANKRGKGRPEVKPQQKAINAVKNALKDAKGIALPVNNRNLGEVIRGIIADASMEELNEVAAVVQKQMEIVQNAKKSAAEAAAKAAESSKNVAKDLKDNQTRTSAGATVTRTDAKPKTKTGVIPPTDKVETPTT